MKKLILTLLIVGLMGCVTACGGTAEPEEPATEEVAEEVKEQAEEPEVEEAEETAEPVVEEANTEEGSLMLTDTYYDVVNLDGEQRVTYAVVVDNPTSNGYGTAGLNITVKDASGNVITEESDFLDFIAPNSVYHYGSWRSIDAAEIGSVDISLDADENDIAADIDWSVPADQLVLSNAAKGQDDLGDTIYTGEITNNSDKDADNVIVTAFYKKGDKIVGGEDGAYVNVPAGSTTQFQFYPHSTYEDCDGFELYISQYWS